MCVCYEADSHTLRPQWSPVVYVYVSICVFVWFSTDSHTPRPRWSPVVYMCMCMSVYVCVCLYVLVQTPILQDPNGDLLYMLCIAGAIIILGMNRAIYTKPSTENWSGCYIIRLYPTISPVHYTAPMLSARAWMLMGGNWWTCSPAWHFWRPEVTC